MIQMIAQYLFLFCIGVLAGLFYFGGLWLTIQKLTESKGAYFWFFVSFVCRSSVVVSVFYLFMNDDWRRILAQAAGFIVVRFVMTSKMKLRKANEIFS